MQDNYPTCNLNFPLASCFLNVWDAPTVEELQRWTATRDEIIDIRTDTFNPLMCWF